MHFKKWHLDPRFVFRKRKECCISSSGDGQQITEGRSRWKCICFNTIVPFIGMSHAFGKVSHGYASEFSISSYSLELIADFMSEIQWPSKVKSKNYTFDYHGHWSIFYPSTVIANRSHFGWTKISRGQIRGHCIHPDGLIGPLFHWIGAY